MPRITADSILQKAIEPATLDRISLADAYSNTGEHAEKALEEAKSIRSLKGKKLEKMSEAELKTAFQTLVWAEQWERSLAQADGGSVYGKKALADANVFSTLRLAIMGKSAFETAIENAKAVDVRSLFKTP